MTVSTISRSSADATAKTRDELQELRALAREDLTELEAFIARINDDTADELWARDSGSMFPSPAAWGACLSRTRRKRVS